MQEKRSENCPWKCFHAVSGEGDLQKDIEKQFLEKDKKDRWITKYNVIC